MVLKVTEKPFARAIAESAISRRMLGIKGPSLQYRECFLGGQGESGIGYTKGKTATPRTHAVEGQAGAAFHLDGSHHFFVVGHSVIPTQFEPFPKALIY